jgi:hypothetical protein
VSVVAIHQPNYLPWLGYFAKIARASIFVFLNDAQYPKGGYVNRVKVADAGSSWLTIPVNVNLGDPISSVSIARADWARTHRERLLQLYRTASSFKAVWPEIEGWLAHAPQERLADANIHLIRKFAIRLGLSAQFELSSTLGVEEKAADVRLAEIVRKLAPGGRYLSGQGGANYQTAEVFSVRGVELVYNDFTACPYARAPHAFEPGLSILDAIFHVGWDATSDMIRPKV